MSSRLDVDHPAGTERSHCIPGYPGYWGKRTPGAIAVVDADDGAQITHGELDQRSERLAQVWRDAGLKHGDHVAIFMENHLRFFEVIWAALRSGLVITPVSRHLTAAEAGYIVADCDAKSIVTTAALTSTATGLIDASPTCTHRLMIDGTAPGYSSYEEALDSVTPELTDDEPYGALMLYSSGTTGRPKGIAQTATDRPASQGPGNARFVGRLFGIDERTVYLSPVPMYHSAPLTYCLAVLSLGGTVVYLRKFDPVTALKTIEHYRVTHSQWVPTHFVRMLRLPPEERLAFDLSSQQVAIHAAAPCPRPIKEEMFDWWGPILHEYYGGSESNGLTYVGPQDWLAHPGTVGRAVIGTVHVCSDSGEELAAGQPGLIYFESPGSAFRYHKDPEQTRSAQHPTQQGWSTLGDVGYLDDDGFLFLTDRATFMIVSGGVNIYPQEIEDVLAAHPAVGDVAVIGVPDPDMGEAVKAVVQSVDGVAPSDELAIELLDFARSRLSHVKCPRSVDFVDELPRLPTGKLRKAELRDRYWAGHEGRLV